MRHITIAAAAAPRPPPPTTTATRTANTIFKQYLRDSTRENANEHGLGEW